MWLLVTVISLWLGDSAADLISRARGGDLDAQWEAASLSRKGQLGQLPPKQAAKWYKQALERRNPAACLEEAQSRLDKNEKAEEWLRCAALGNKPEGQYLLGRLMLNRIAAEDEPHRFEGLAWVALAAKAGYSPAVRRWELMATELTLEDLERVEQTTKQLI